MAIEILYMVIKEKRYRYRKRHIDYPLLRKRKEVFLTDQDEERLQAVVVKLTKSYY